MQADREPTELRRQSSESSSASPAARRRRVRRPGLIVLLYLDAQIQGHRKEIETRVRLTCL